MTPSLAPEHLDPHVIHVTGEFIHLRAPCMCVRFCMPERRNEGVAEYARASFLERVEHLDDIVRDVGGIFEMLDVLFI